MRVYSPSTHPGRKAAARIHPGRTDNDADRHYRNEAMAALNTAYRWRLRPDAHPAARLRTASRSHHRRRRGRETDPPLLQVMNLIEKSVFQGLGQGQQPVDELVQVEMFDEDFAGRRVVSIVFGIAIAINFGI